MVDDLPHHHQHISGVSTENHSQAFVGSARDVYFAGSRNPQEASEKAAIACRNALFLTDPHVDRESVISAKGTRVAGTCEWITRHANYRAWLNGDAGDDGDTRLLWISGGPGKGKTMMSVFLTEELERHTTRIDNAGLVFFFCSAQDDKRNTAVAVLRGLVQQIIEKRPQLVKHALPYFETPERIQQTLSSLEALWLIFSKLIADSELGTTFCVLDGLDECEESTLRVLLLRLVGALAGRTPPSIQSAFKLVIVSRDISGLQSCSRIRLDPDNDKKVVSDIELFITARLAELPRIEGFDDEFESSVQTTLLERAQGTFLWVGYAMYELSQKQTCSEIWEVLEDLPSGLPAIYSRMLLRIPAKHRDTSRAILRWVAMAVRPLNLQELAAATDIQRSFPQVTIEQAIRDAIALCGPLLKVQEREVSLIHQSARDYLLRKECESGAVLEAFQFEGESAHFELARECLNCVAQSDLQYRVIDFDLETELGPQESPLLRYAILYWPEHAKQCSALAVKLFDPYGFFLQEKSCLRDHWCETYENTTNVYASFRPWRPQLLHMACFWGIIPWIEAILAKRSWRPRRHRRANYKDNRERTALHLAAQKGNEVAVRLLVDRGADPEARNVLGRTVLHCAAGEGNEAVVRLLLKSGANIRAKDNHGQTMMHLAAMGENEAIVRLMVDFGADVKAKDDYGWTVLHSAAETGNEMVVRLLIGLGADVNATSYKGRTVLQFAAVLGKKSVVQLLIDRGADVMLKNDIGETVLHAAAQGGNEAVVQLLVDLGADINAKDNDGKTVLHSAASGWTGKAVIQLLVDLGVDIKAKDNNGETALHSAASAGNENEAVVQLLVDLGADINAKDNDGKTVLHSAASGWRNKAVIQLLVDLGADTKAKDNNRETALHLAASAGREEEVVQLLVDLGADIKAKNSNGKTARHLASAKRNNKAIAQLLRDLEAVEAKERNARKRNAL